MSNLLNTPDTTADFTAADIEKNKVMAVLSYLGILVLVPIFAAKESAFAKFHVVQGVNLLLLEVVFYLLSYLMSFLLGSIGFLLALWGIVSWVINLAILALMILGIVNAVQGKAKELPVIGGFRILK